MAKITDTGGIAFESPWQKLGIAGRPPRFDRMFSGQDHGNETFQDFDLLLGVRGDSTLRMLGQTLELRAGTIILVPANVTFRNIAGLREGPLKMFSHFNCRVSGQVISDARPYVDPEEMSLTLPGLPTIALVGEVDPVSLSEKLLNIRNRPPDDLAHLMLAVVLMDVIRHLRATYLGLGDLLAGQRLDRATRFMGQNLSRGISVQDIAEHVHVSQKTLRRLFRKHYNVSPVQHLTHMRMARARELLQGRDLDITGIARICGYSSIQYFSRAFSKAFNEPPSVYRKRMSRVP